MKTTWPWSLANLAVWPLAVAIASVVAVGQDPAGAAMYGGMAFLGTIVLLGMPLSARLAWLLRRRGGQASIGERVAAISSIVLVLLVAVPMIMWVWMPCAPGPAGPPPAPPPRVS